MIPFDGMVKVPVINPLDFALGIEPDQGAFARRLTKSFGLKPVPGLTNMMSIYWKMTNIPSLAMILLDAI